MVTEIVRARLRQESKYKFSVIYDDLEGSYHSDEPKPLGGSEAPGATEMLTAAIGHCLGSSLLFCMEKSRSPAKRVDVDVETHRSRNEQGRWRIDSIKVVLKADPQEGGQEKLDRCKGIFEQFCIVTESVRKGIPVEVKVETGGP